MKKAQFGRSILEVLSVLVIIALITVAGIRLWQEARLESQTHTLAQRLTAIKNSRLLSMNAHAGERMPRTEKGPYDTIFTIENGVGDKNKDWFWIDVKTNSSSLCGVLTEFDIGAGYTKDECESTSNVTFYFLKFPEADSSTTPDKDSQPRECPANAVCDSDFNPIGCVDGYFLSNGNCIECPENSMDCKDDGFECESGYYKNGNTCTSCGTGVVTCDENGNPTECEEGYYLNGNSCVQCPTTGVASCTSNGFTCQAGYYKNGNSCTSCGTGVLSCDSTGKPTACQTGYYLNGNTCTPCGANVTECNESGLPIKCEKGYKLDGNNCVEDDGCGENQCCLKMLDAGYVLDKESSGTNGTFLMKDNETIKYNGRLNVEKDLDISECKLSFSDQSVLQVSVSEGKTLKVNSILIRSDGNNDNAYSVQNYGTIYSDSLTTNASIINRGTLNISDIDASAQMINVGITNYGTINSDNITVVGEEESFETGNLSKDLYAIRNTGTITATNKINVKAAKGLDNSGKLSAKNITCSIFSGPITAAGGVFTPETCILNSNSIYSTVKTLEATNIEIEKGNLQNDGSLQASKIEIKNGGLYNVYGEATIGTLIAYGGEYGLASCGECNCIIASTPGNITNAYLQGSKKAYCQGFYTGTIQNLYYCGSAGSTDMSIVNKVNDCSWMN